MVKEQLKNKLNSQKGISSGDIIIAMLILVTTLGVIMMIYQNLVIGGKEVDRKAGATRIAVNLMENIDMLFYEQIDDELKALTDSGYATTNDNINYVISNTKAFNTTIPKGYTLKLKLEDIGSYELVRKLTIKVEYNQNNQKEDVTLNKVIEKEVVRECNSPRFSEEYIRQMIPTGSYILYSKISSVNPAEEKVICPIRYNGNLKKYSVVEDESEIWYSYSNKNWARVIIIDSNLLSTYVNTSNNTIQDESILKSANSYVWIPRFGVENGKDLWGYTRFKYKTTNLAILNDYTGDALKGNYVDIDNTITWANRGISFDNSELPGLWTNYSQISQISTDAYYLNESQYGPMVEY